MAGRVSRTHLFEAAGRRLAIKEDRAPAIDESGAGFLEDSRLVMVLHGADAQLSVGQRRLEPVLPDQNTAVYILDLDSTVGELDLVLSDAAGAAIASWKTPVQRRKLASDADLRTLEEHWCQMRLPVTGRRRNPVTGQASLGGNGADAFQWAAWASESLRTLRQHASSIAHRPRKATQRLTSIVPTSRARMGGVALLNAVVSGRTAIELSTAVHDVDQAAATLAGWDSKWLRRVISELRRELAGDSLAPAFEAELARIEKDLERIERAARGAGNPRFRPSVMQDTRYRNLHAASVMARRGRRLDSGLVRQQRPPTYELYEHWCARALVEALVPPAEVDAALGQLASEREVRIDAPGASAKLRAQREIAVPSLGGVRTPSRPDFVIEVENPEKVVIFDAKYRVAPDLKSAPIAALDELHLYRDLYLLHRPQARHKEVWAAILYPAPAMKTDEAWTMRMFLSAIHSDARVGAIPLSPSIRAPLRDFLVKVGLAEPEGFTLGVHA